MNKTFIINGTGGVGKDTFIDFIEEYLFHNTGYYVSNISSVDGIKEIARFNFGYKGEKTTEWRKSLSDLKDIQTRMCNGPFYFMLEEWRLNNERDSGFSFFHIREPEEIEKFKTETGAKTILIKRNGFKTTGNHADENVEKYEYDYIIENNGSLCEFRDAAENFIKVFC